MTRDIANELAELRRDFASRLPARFAAVVDAVRAARAGTGSIAEARGLAHRLGGTAGSYGHATAGRAIGVIEELLADSALPAIDWARVEQALDTARRVIDDGAP